MEVFILVLHFVYRLEVFGNEV